MAIRMIVEPNGILKGDTITNFRPYDPDSRPSKIQVKQVERPRGCRGTHINGNACVTVAVEVERN